ncbi:MAG: DNA repair protein RecN [Candidatus Omnitrophica bacterium]|nr:DNA repair protein RecN [Candidatus Omnitrophota bacterium]
MISSLSIRNFGLIDKLEIEFCSQLNIFTGETGAGKSILIDALRYALGERLNNSLVRDPAKPCIVEVVFEFNKKQLKEMPDLLEYLSVDDPCFIVNRAYMPDGRNKNKINDFTLTLGRLKEIGNLLVDFHGPHDHQMLFAWESHINILDRLCDLDKVKADYNKGYEQYLKFQRQLKELQDLSQDREREQDMLKYQIEELSQVPLEQAKYEELLRKKSRIDNSEKLYKCLNELISILEDEQTGLTETISRAFGPLEALNDIDETTVEFKNILDRIQEDSSDLLSSLSNYSSGLSFEPEQAGEVNAQYDSYYEIIRKYGPGIENAASFYEKTKEKYDLLNNLENNDADLRKKIDARKKDLTKIAQKITVGRKKGALILEQTIEKELKDLGIIHVDFQCRITEQDLDLNGQDKVVFYISPNAGESLKPLAEIVSSGEAARVMLALKKALTKVDPMPVLIFDEIDAQIGGRLGTIIGKKLKSLSLDRQVILITHLPQIASFGDYHFKVAKKVKDNRTLINVDRLDKDSRLKELAQMMAGEKETKVSLEHARDMLALAK